MLSYRWAEKTICKKIFQQLISKGFRVWFDEKDMHGRSCSAMAHAIENSQCIVICMSENYENSNACHHEAEYAYVRQCRMVPLVVQSKYKARKWLGFIIGSLIYIDFTKHVFDKAFNMLEDELKPACQTTESATPVLSIEKVETKQVVTTEYANKQINQWTSEDVVSWCHTHHLSAFRQLLEHYDGASLLRLYHISKTNDEKDTFRLLQDDSQRLAGNGQSNLTFTEFIRFQTELERRINNEQSHLGKNNSTKTCALL
ncbi:unnamed protein product [Adineta ricciae]|uniref:TIR domain-containing protein n=2 Tax=Adineta ricciae TaxID=249248 RepID=A0A814NIT4_ADIRI|nr:unnamed protein product [Adineta ricciae]